MASKNLDLSASDFLEVDGVRVHYKAAGTGSALLLLHGWGASLETMSGLFGDLSKYYRVVAIDFPGHGKSQLPPAPWGIPEYTDCLLGVMERLTLARPHVVAHSFGGRVAIRLARFHPERVNKIVLTGGAGVPPPRPLKYYPRVALARTAKLVGKYGGSVGRAARASVYARLGSTDYLSAGPLRDTFVKVVNDDQTAMLQHIKSPTLLVWGADDNETPVASARIMERLIPGSQLVILENAGHYSFLDQANKFLLIVKRFLREPASTSANA